MIIQRFVTVLFVFTLSACGGGSSNGGGTPVSVITVSGIQASLNGTYSTGCRTKSGVDVVEGLIISDGTWAYTRNSYATNDESCSAGETSASSILATLSAAGGMGAITGWTDSGGPVTAPNAADLSGPLSNTEPYTTLSLTATAASGAGTYTLSAMGDTVSFYFIVDDTGANNLLYIPDFDAANHMVSATPSGSFTKL